MKYKPLFVIILTAILSTASSTTVFCGEKAKAISASDSIVSVKSYGFVDLEGAKPSTIVIEYDKEIDASSLNISIEEQNQKDIELTSNDSSLPGSGIYWATFTRGSHMSTWKYGYQLDYPYEWLFKQTRQSEISRGKVEKLKNKWLGRDDNGKVKPGSGTANFNSAQYTPHGKSDIFVENWTPISATNQMIKKLLDEAEKMSFDDFSKSFAKIKNYYKLLTNNEKLLIKNYSSLLSIDINKKLNR